MERSRASVSDGFGRFFTFLTLILSISVAIFSIPAQGAPAKLPRRLLARRSENPSYASLIKRAKEPIPTQEETDAAFQDPGVPCIFYTGSTEASAEAWTQANGLDYCFIDDSRADFQGWGELADGTPSARGYDPVGEGTGTEDEAWTGAEQQTFWNRMSASFAKVCSGEVFVATANGYAIPENGVFYVYELPEIKANLASGKVTKLTAVPLTPGDDGSPSTTGELKQLLPCEGS